MDIGNKFIAKEIFQCNVGFASFSLFLVSNDIVDIAVCLPSKLHNLSSLASKPINFGE